MWRLWLEGKATMTELERMTIDEVDTANRWLDSQARAQDAARRKAER